MKTKPTKSDVVFVSPVHDKEIRSPAALAQREMFAICQPRQMSGRRIDCYLPYFFTQFLPMNTFASEKFTIAEDLLTMVHSSAALRDAITAVAALHAKQQGPLDEVRIESTEALKAYMRSVSIVQNSIAAGSFMTDQSALWTTFLLGLFEVCMLETSCAIANIPGADQSILAYA